MSQKSDTLSAEDVAVVKTLLYMGFQQKRIAALFDVNQGRIAEINNGRVHVGVDRLSMSREIVTRYPIKKKGQDR